MSTENHKPECGWVKLYSPRGPQVTLPVTGEPLDYARLLANVAAMLDAGWLVQATGLGEGEHKDEIAYVVHRSKDNEDGTSTPIVDLYSPSDAMKFSVLTVYLNHPADVAAFEHASKMKLADIPAYIGAGKLERGASRQTDTLIKKAPKPFVVIWKDNPRYDPNEQDTKKKKPKRLFFRWEDAAPAQPPANGQHVRPNANVCAQIRDLLRELGKPEAAGVGHYSKGHSIVEEMTPAEATQLLAYLLAKTPASSDQLTAIDAKAGELGIPAKAVWEYATKEGQIAEPTAMSRSQAAWLKQNLPVLAQRLKPKPEPERIPAVQQADTTADADQVPW